MKRGFTLIELMVVIAVIAILATIGLFGLGQAQKSARDTQRQQVMNGLRAALQRYYGDRSSYPSGPFTNMMYSLTGANYVLTTALPVDPGCGGGKSAYPFGTDIANWLPCGSTQQVTYSYAVSGSDYTLFLFREGGGSNLFQNPR